MASRKRGKRKIVLGGMIKHLSYKQPKMKHTDERVEPIPKIVKLTRLRKVFERSMT